MLLPDGHHLAIFAIAAIALIVMPGPAVFYVIARSVAQGRAAGLVSALGIALGGLAHVAAAALGVSALVLASATAFTALKLLGAAYLVFLGLRTLFAADDADDPAPRVTVRSMRRVFTDGAIVNLLNPKTALFFLAFLPQFVDPSAGSVPAQMASLGLLFVAIAVFSDGAYAVLAGSLAARLRPTVRVRRVRRWFTGSVYLGLGIAMAFAGAGEGGAEAAAGAP